MNATVAKLAVGSALGKFGLKSTSLSGVLPDGATAIGIRGARPAGPAIDWNAKNFPPYLKVVHFDLAELRAREGNEDIKKIIKWLWLACRLILGIFAFNFVNTIVLTATIKGGAYSGVNIFLSLVEAAVLFSATFAVCFFAYRGWLEPNGRAKTIARPGAFIMCAIGLIMALSFGSNVHGWTGFGSSAFTIAQAADTAGSALGYWRFVIVIESLAWMAYMGIIGFGGYLMFV